MLLTTTILTQDPEGIVTQGLDHPDAVHQMNHVWCVPRAVFYHWPMDPSDGVEGDVMVNVEFEVPFEDIFADDEGNLYEFGAELPDNYDLRQPVTLASLGVSQQAIEDIDHPELAQGMFVIQGNPNIRIMKVIVVRDHELWYC